MQKESSRKTEKVKQPHRLSYLDEPSVYAGAFLFSIAVYIDSLREESAVNQGFEWTRKLLLDLGHYGPITSTKKLIGWDCPCTQNVIMALAIIALTVATVRSWKQSNAAASGQPGEQQKAFTKQLTLQEYEL